jgi:predicted protein tyrosine phosphatase
MPWIQNVSMQDVRNAHHYDPGPRGVLIQIVDPDMSHPTAKYGFSEVYRFKFLDIEDESPLAISKEQAERLVRILKDALQKNQNVVVHCVAGICRSGAVVEVGIQLGFEDPKIYRQPNLRVKHLCMEKL